MKKLWNNVIMLLTLSSLVLLNSCGTDPEPPDTTLPDANGTVQISFLNFPGTGDVTTTAAAGDVVSVAVQVQKAQGGNRPQKLRVYETNVRNTRGTQFGQTIDLRNTDDPQIKNVNYTVPQSANGTIYLYFEVDESASAFSRKLLVINIGGAGISNYTGITLGAQTNQLASRLSSATGQLYSACNAAANINDIDVTYAVPQGTSGQGFVSNPARTQAPFNLSSNPVNCGDNQGDQNLSTAGGRPTYFAKVTGNNFDTITDEQLGQLSVTNSSQQYVLVNQGDLVAFLRNDGKKGLIRVNSISAGAAGSITFDLKVQR